MKVATIAILVFVSTVASVWGNDPIRKYNIDANGVTVGGLSAGGFMAVQYHLAFSSELVGAAVFAGGPFYCAQGSVTTALTTCMNALPTQPSASAAVSAAKQYAQNGDIDDLTGLATDNVFLYSGSQDTVVATPVMKAAAQMYQQLITSGNVTTEFDVDSEHCLPTLNYGEACASLGSPYIGNCNYDGAGISLAAMYGELSPSGSSVGDNLQEFDQTAFSSSSVSSISMNDKGYIYVPTACQQGSLCKLHIQFHGCQQTLADIGTKYVEHGGFNEWAETNNIIVLYPQAIKSQFAPSNPQGCFDWWGYTNADYAKKTGPQVALVHAIVNKLTGNN